MATAIIGVTAAANKVQSPVEEVHGGSEQQARGIQQIARAVARMEQVTQQLAATAKESAASGTELSSPARGIDDIVDNLRQLFATDATPSPLAPPATYTRPPPAQIHS